MDEIKSQTDGKHQLAPSALVRTGAFCRADTAVPGHQFPGRTKAEITHFALYPIT